MSDDAAHEAIASAYAWLSTPSSWSSLSVVSPTALAAWDAAFVGPDAPSPSKLLEAVARLRELVAACVEEMKPRVVAAHGSTDDVGSPLSSSDDGAMRRQRAVESLREGVCRLSRLLSALRDQEALAALLVPHMSNAAESMAPEGLELLESSPPRAVSDARAALKHLNETIDKIRD